MRSRMWLLCYFFQDLIFHIYSFSLHTSSSRIEQGILHCISLVEQVVALLWRLHRWRANPIGGTASRAVGSIAAWHVLAVSARISTLWSRLRCRRTGGEWCWCFRRIGSRITRGALTWRHGRIGSWRRRGLFAWRGRGCPSSLNIGYEQNNT